MVCPRIALLIPQRLNRELFSRFLALDAQCEIAWAAEIDASLLPADMGRIDVAVVDLEIPADRSRKLLQVLRAAYSPQCVIFLGTGPNDLPLGNPLSQDGDALILKSAPLHDLVDCLRGVLGARKTAASETRIAPQLPKSPPGRQLRIDAAHGPLTGREVEVLRCLAEGDSVKEAAGRLHLSPKSVNNHKYRIMQKLGLNDRVHLARYAIREGLIEA
ncbi:MAG: response regulator transcription factor [Planctomycetaceae bacterium]|nr:response regulator transcription factor [Planctomycetaceae bacterium]